jgi:hypothetical protein
VITRSCLALVVPAAITMTGMQHWLHSAHSGRWYSASNYICAVLVDVLEPLQEHASADAAALARSCQPLRRYCRPKGCAFASALSGCLCKWVHLFCAVLCLRRLSTDRLSTGAASCALQENIKTSYTAYRQLG